MTDYYETVPRGSPAEKLAAAYERGARDRLRDATRREPTNGSPVAELPQDQLFAYIDGWLDAFKAELRQSNSKSKLKGVLHVNDKK